jgi:hypothetical protein
VRLQGAALPFERLGPGVGQAVVEAVVAQLGGDHRVQRQDVVERRLGDALEALVLRARGGRNGSGHGTSSLRVQ